MPNRSSAAGSRDRGYLSAILVLGSGTAAAHAITLLVTPILTRLYSPGDFGAFAVYMSIAGLVGVAAGLRYEVAIVLPKAAKEASILLAIALSSTVAMSLFMAAVVALFGERIAIALGTPELGTILWLLPLGVLLRGTYQSLNIFLTRRQRIRQISVSRIGQTATAAGAQLGLASTLGAAPIGLVAGHLAGTLIAIAVLGRKHAGAIARALYRLRDVDKTKALIRRYSTFPRFDMPASLLNTGTYELPVLILASFFVEAVVGEFAVAMRVAMLPTVFVSASLAQIYYQRAAAVHQRYGTARDITVRSLRGLFLVSFPCYLSLGLAAPWLFTPLLGGQWTQAGLYVAALSPMCFFMLLVAPLSQLFFVYGKQRVFFIFQLAYFVSSLVSFTVAGISGEPLLGAGLFSVLGSVRYVVMLVYLCRLDGITFEGLVWGAGARAQ